MKGLKRAKLMLAVVAFGLFASGITVWSAVPELKIAILNVMKNLKSK